MNLRKYQKEDAILIHDKLSQHRNVMYQLPTGGGKTEVAIEVVRLWLRQHPNAKIIWMTHRKELEKQSKIRILDSIAIEDDKLYVASPIKINNQNINTNRNDLMIVDESHHAVAKTWTKAIQKFRGTVLGMSATPYRSSRTEGFDHIYDELITGPSITELIEQGYLVNPKVYSPSYGKIEGISRTVQDYSMSKTWAEPKNRPLLVELGVEWLKKFGNRKTIIYTVGQQHAKSVFKESQKKGFTPGIILGDNQHIKSSSNYLENRNNTLSKFINNEYDTLINCEVLTEGVDIPDCDTILKLRPTLSLALDMQMSGRVMRTLPDGREKDAIILDAAHNFERHGLPSEPRNWKLEPREPNKMPKGNAPYKICPHCRCVCATMARKCNACNNSLGVICEICGSFNPSKICTVCSIQSQTQLFTIPNPNMRKRQHRNNYSSYIQKEISQLYKKPKSQLFTNGNIDIDKVKSLFNKKMELYNKLKHYTPKQ